MKKSLLEKSRQYLPYHFVKQIAQGAGFYSMDAENAVEELLVEWDGSVPVDELQHVLGQYDLSLDDCIPEHEGTEHERAYGNDQDELDAYNREQGLIEANTPKMKTQLNETSFAIQTSKNIMNYEDQDIVKAIKALFKDYDGFTCTKIAAVGDSTFYNVEVVATLDDDYADLELKRYTLTQKVHQFKNEFLSDLSSYFPVVNANVGNYNFVKGDDELQFTVTLLLSNTKNRDWVSGKMDKPAKTKLGDKIMDAIEKRELKEGDKLNELTKGLANHAMKAGFDSTANGSSDPFFATKRANQIQKFANYVSKDLKDLAARYGANLVPSGVATGIDSTFSYLLFGPKGQPAKDLSNAICVVEVHADTIKIDKGNVSNLTPEQQRSVPRLIKKMQADMQTTKSPVQEAEELNEGTPEEFNYREVYEGLDSAYNTLGAVRDKVARLGNKELDEMLINIRNMIGVAKRHAAKYANWSNG